MKSDKRYTPETIATDSVFFSVPLYQRLFAWEDTQVKKLLEDLYEHYISPLKETPYYLGQMTIVPDSGHFSIVDGQQRFTVMTLLAIVFKGYAPCWEGFLKYNGIMRLSFAGRSEDQQYILFKIENREHINYYNTKMEQAISCIQKFIDSISANGCNIEMFAKHIFCKMSFFLSELPSSYLINPPSLNKYFEAMNSTGKGLESHEILKVELMRGCDNQEYMTRIWNAVSRMEQPLIGYNKENEGIERCRERYIQAIQYCMEGNYEWAFNICMNERESQLDSSRQVIAEIEAKPLAPQTFHDNSESSVISFPEFLLLVLDLTNEGRLHTISDYDFYKKEKLLSRFHDYKPTDIHKFYNNLLLYRLLLDYYVDRVEYIQGVGYHYLLFKDDESEGHRCLRQYEAMLHVSTTNFYEWLKPLLIYIKENGTQVSSSQMLLELKRIDNMNHPFVDGINMFRYGMIDRYWFWRLDYYLWEKRSIIFDDFGDVDLKAILNYEFRANRSIEHLHPQNEDYNIQWNKDIYDLNDFGNLAMISQSFNSTQSNDSVKVKFARIEDQVVTGNLQSLKLYHMYLSANKSPDGWNEQNAKDNGEVMFNILKESYNSSNN